MYSMTRMPDTAVTIRALGDNLAGAFEGDCLFIRVATTGTGSAALFTADELRQIADRMDEMAKVIA